jgi:hypothetical protein
LRYGSHGGFSGREDSNARRSPHSIRRQPAEFFEQLFRTETQKDLGALCTALEEGDRSLLSLLAHRLRGRGRIMNYPRFEELAGRLETLADGQDFAAMGEGLEALRAYFEAMPPVSGDQA